MGRGSPVATSLSLWHSAWSGLSPWSTGCGSDIVQNGRLQTVFDYARLQHLELNKRSSL